jgi:glycosyltransferase involved in cell wall biosynthesis
VTPVPLAIFMSSFDPGGTERQMIELVRRLDRSRWTVHVATFHARGGWFHRVAGAVESVAEFPLTTFRGVQAGRSLWAFAQWCRARRIAVVQTTELYSNIFALPGAALAGVPVRIGSRREINPDKSVAHIAMQRAGYVFATAVVANSRAAARRLQLEAVPAKKIRVIANGLDVGPMAHRTDRGTRRKVVVVANLRREKGHDVLIDAAATVLRHFPDATFEIVGGGPERGALAARADVRGVAHAFSFLGHQDDVPARLAAADIFVLPSRSEAFPNAVLEAMAAGMPIVASGVGGVIELIDDRRTGLLIPAGDPQALADGICQMMTDTALAARLGAAARDEAESSYSFDRMVAAFDSLYQRELVHRGVAVSSQPQLAAS